MKTNPLCKGCLSEECGICPMDDGYRCFGCPCKTCKETDDGTMSNYYESYDIHYGK